MAIASGWSCQTKMSPPYHHFKRTLFVSEPVAFRRVHGELDELLQACHMKRNVVELNYEVAQWKHKAVWTRKYMEAKRGHGLLLMWNDHSHDRGILRAASAAARKPRPVYPIDSSFEHQARTVSTAPPLTRALSLRAVKEWEMYCESLLHPAPSPRRLTGAH